MSYLIDTNIISEVQKQKGCDPHVAQWYASIGDDEIYLSVLVLGEIRKGIELVRPRDPRKAMALEGWLSTVRRAFDGRILSIDSGIANEWGKMNAPHPRAVIDCLMAATAQVHGLTLVTRNIKHVEGIGVRTLNPFEFQAPLR